MTMLEAIATPKLRQLGIEFTSLHFQQGGAITLTAQNSMAVVCHMFRELCSPVSTKLLGQLDWSTSVYQTFLMGLLKECGFQRRIMNIQELKEATIDEVVLM